MASALRLCSQRAGAELPAQLPTADRAAGALATGGSRGQSTLGGSWEVTVRRWQPGRSVECLGRLAPEPENLHPKLGRPLRRERGGLSQSLAAGRDGAIALVLHVHASRGSVCDPERSAPLRPRLCRGSPRPAWGFRLQPLSAPLPCVPPPLGLRVPVASPARRADAILWRVF